MSRYIDVDALIRNLQERYCRPCKASGLDYGGVKCKACPLDDEIDDIDGFADNSIDIVRCRECKHREKRVCSEITFYECNHLRYQGTRVGVTDIWFCADGERREP